MITTTPIVRNARQHNRDVSIPSRPTTPLRSASRTSFRASQTSPSHDIATTEADDAVPLDRIVPAIAELSGAMVDLEANFMHLQLLNESIARFNENFASFLYGLNMTAFCVDFPEASTLHLIPALSILAEHMSSRQHDSCSYHWYSSG